MLMFLACVVTPQPIEQPTTTSESEEVWDSGEQNDGSDSDSSEEDEEEEVEDTDVDDDTDEDETESGGSEPTTEIADYSATGPYAVNVSSATASVTDCSSMSYDIYSPQTAQEAPTVVLGHGFARGADKMSGHANHFASWGFEVLVPTLCHYNVWVGVDHEMNGQNMMELATHHGATQVVYAGQSAGGLAAIIAASQDSKTVGVLGLDATDTQGVPGVADFIGQQYASNVAVPAFGLVGEASSCNSDNNGLMLFGMMNDSRTMRIVGSDHCDYESPTDFGCETFCRNDAEPFPDQQIRPLVTQLATAALMIIADLSDDGEEYWSGSIVEGFVASGEVQKNP